MSIKTLTKFSTYSLKCSPPHRTTSALSETKIAAEHLEDLQRNLLRSHAVGVGPALGDDVVRALLMLRAHTLALGASGVRPVVPQRLLALLNAFIMAANKLVLKSLTRTERPEAIVTYMVLLLTPLSLVPALFFWEWPSLEGWVWLICLASTAIACGNKGPLVLPDDEPKKTRPSAGQEN